MRVMAAQAAQGHDSLSRTLIAAVVIRQLGTKPPVVVAFEADAGGQEPVSCLIAAERLDIVRETVLRYWRENAAPDQRFAPWVRTPVR